MSSRDAATFFSLHVINPNLGRFRFLARSGDVVPPHLRNKNRGLRAKPCRNSSDFLIMIGVLLVIDRYETIASYVDSFARRIEHHVVSQRRAWQAGDGPARFRVKHQEPCRLPAHDEKPMICFIQGERSVSLISAETP